MKGSKGSYYVISDFGLPPMLDLAPCCESSMKKWRKEQGHIKVQLGLVWTKSKKSTWLQKPTTWFSCCEPNVSPHGRCCPRLHLSFTNQKKTSSICDTNVCILIWHSQWPNLRICKYEKIYLIHKPNICLKYLYLKSILTSKY
jgi:hypothetical protein